MKLKSDKFKRARDGRSRSLAISCVKCGHHLFFYQKDGIGMLKRLYLDRIYPTIQSAKDLTCSNCETLVGIKYIYKKEERPAYRLLPGAVSKKIVSAPEVS